MFNAMELDAIGEVMNISLGSSATAVSNLLDHRVDITTPSVSVVPVEEFSIEMCIRDSSISSWLIFPPSLAAAAGAGAGSGAGAGAGSLDKLLISIPKPPSSSLARSTDITLTNSLFSIFSMLNVNRTTTSIPSDVWK